MIDLGPRLKPRTLERLARRVPAVGPRDTIKVAAPATGGQLGEVPSCLPEDVADAAGRARRAQEAWFHREIDHRGEVFLRFHDLLLERQEEILDLVQLESGKARKHAFEEVADAAIVTRYYALHAARHLAAESRKGALPGLTQTWEHHLPKGLVGVISPWNYPLSLAVTDTVPALMAGNAVLLKPDRQTPFTALWAADLLLEAGLPPDLLQVLPGAGSVLGPALIELCDFVTFTGSTASGREVARQAGAQLIDCTLELGGKNAMVVLPDTDLDAAVAGAVRGCFASAGQLCISIERLFVHEAIYPHFLDRFVAATKALRLGFALDYSTDLGSLASAQQLDTVQKHVADAVAKGARVHTGGRARPDLGPFFYEPTILSAVAKGMTPYAEETFGPVVALYRFSSLAEAIERVNETRYGLNASLWTADIDLARRTAGRLRVGTVNINEAYAAAWASVDAPMGGMKESGLGRRHGSEGILKYTDSQTVSIQRFLPLGAPSGVPEELYSRLLSGALRVLRHFPGLR